MLITLFKYKKRCQRVGCAVVVLALSMAGWFFTPASAEEGCATDFFSQKTYDVALRDDLSADDLTQKMGALENISEVVLIASKNDVDY